MQVGGRQSASVEASHVSWAMRVRTASAEALLLSEGERIALRASWSNDFDIMYAIGAEIYTELFRVRLSCPLLSCRLMAWKVVEPACAP